jgi:hypothetical protein
MEEFMARLRAGACSVRNPFNAGLERRVSLAPEDLDCIVFWTRDPRPLLPCIAELEARRIPFYVQVTLTGYPASIEPGSPRPEDAIEAISALSGRIGPDRVLWRYDPIFLARSSQGGEGGEGGSSDLGADWHRANFRRLAARLEGKAERVIVSLLDEYAHTRARLEEAGLNNIAFGTTRPGKGGAPLNAARSAGPDGGDFQLEAESSGAGKLPPPPFPDLLAEIAACAVSRGFSPRACAEPWDLGPLGIAPSSCIDAGLASRVAGRPIAAARDRGQRPGCGCAASVDIGSYGPCPSRCAYCYARR